MLVYTSSINSLLGNCRLSASLIFLIVVENSQTQKKMGHVLLLYTRASALH